MNKRQGEGFSDNRCNDNKSVNGAETNYVGKGLPSSKMTDGDKYSDLGGLSSLDID